MRALSLPRTLGVIVAIVAVLSTLSSLSLPVLSRRPPALATAMSLVFLAAHAALYWHGERFRGRYGSAMYVALQAALWLGIALARVPTGIAIGLLMMLTLELVVITRGRWSSVAITAGAIALYVTAELLTSGLYRAATGGLLLAVAGGLAHVIAALLERAPATIPSAPPSITADALRAAIPHTEAPASASPGLLSARETAVLRELVRGARNSEIGSTLGISERTVKAHLANIYQKLGVQTRSAAVAAALERQLVSVAPNGDRRIDSRRS